RREPMTMDRQSPARWFPLVPRGRPAAGRLDDRVREIADLATAAAEGPLATRLTVAAEAQNKAALIASDCGMPDLARTLCWRQFDVSAAAAPLAANAAQLAVQPLINLGRLAMRGGDGATAYHLFENLYRATRGRTAVTIDGRTINIGDIIRGGEDTTSLTTFL